MPESRLPRASHRAVCDALRRGSVGPVSADPRARAAVAFDFGALVHRRPDVVSRPADAADIAHAMRVAAEYDVPIAARATGHSLAGQAQTPAGVLLDLRAFAGVGEARLAGAGDDEARTHDGWLDAAPGAVWDDVLRAALRRGLLPPVRTSNRFTTVGGTHAVGGLGPMSLRLGAQVDHCLGLELATPDGALRWCSPRHEPALFAHALAGLGQLGVITRVRVGLRRPPAAVWRWRLLYDRRDAMLADLLALAAEPHVDALGAEGLPLPGRGGAGRVRWGWALDVAVYGAEPSGAALRVPAGGLSPARVVGPVRRAIADDAFAGERTDLRRARRRRVTRGHPWVDAIFPVAAAVAYLGAVERVVPPGVLARGRILVWPLAPRRITRPLLVMPDADLALLVSVMPSVPCGELQAAAGPMLALARLAAAMGGRRYPYGWGDGSHAAWRAHYGAAWESLVALKQRHDPTRRCNAQVIAYEPAPGAAREVA